MCISVSVSLSVSASVSYPRPYPYKWNRRAFTVIGSMADDTLNVSLLFPSLRVLEVVLADYDVQIPGWNGDQLIRSARDNHRQNVQVAGSWLEWGPADQICTRQSQTDGAGFWLE